MARLPFAIALVIVALLVAAPPAEAAPGWVWPVRGEVITPYRNGDDPYAGGQHRGVDIAAPVGAAVVAARSGVVRFAGGAGHSGLTVGIRTADGRYDTSYLHLSAVSVRQGQRVAAGQRLGSAGTSGRPSSPRPHLHFGVRDADSRHAYHDPLGFLPPPARPRPSPHRPPVPVGAPARPSPAPLAEPAPRAAPRAAPRRSPRGAPGRAPRPVPVPGPRPAPRVHGAPSGAPVAAPARRAEPSRVPQTGPADAPARAPAPEPAPAERRPVRQPEAAGPDLGLVLACLGLLLAAALIGMKGGRDEVPRRDRGLQARAAALLRPLTGRG
jgi:hypothetical protein